MSTPSSANKILVYDDQCPLCCCYTAVFVKAGWLNKRLPFSQITDKELGQLDASRACNEIPLIDETGGATRYGMESLIFILGNRFPLIGRLYGLRPVKWFFEKLYKFISCNRKQIAPAGRSQGYDCSPAFNLKYRLAYIVFAFLCSTLLSGAFVYAQPVYSNLAQMNISLAIAGAKWALLPFIGLMLLKGEERFNYLGQLATICLMGSLLLLPGIFIPHKIVFFLSLIASILVMTREFYRRMRLLGLGTDWFYLWLLVLAGAISGQFILFAQ